MFDWLSISTEMPETSQKIIHFFNDNNLNLETKISQVGELLDYGKQLGEYKGIIFSIWPNGKVKFYFSPHKLYNEIKGIVNNKGRSMNHDTFTLEKLSFIIKWLKINFEIEPGECYIHQIEFGFNLARLGIDTNDVLNCLISYKGKRFNSMATLGNGRGEEVNFTKYYRIKIYDKSLQNDIDYNILRIEFKALKMQPVSDVFRETTTFSSLLLPEIWLACKNFLLKHIDLCVIGDKFKPVLSDSKKLKLSYWSNPTEWVKMKADTRCKQKIQFEEFISEAGTLQIKSTIISAIELEFNEMIKNKKCNDFTY